MLHLLEDDSFGPLQGFNELKAFPLIHAVCLRLQQGHVFVDKQAHPGIIFVINSAGFSFLYVAPQRAFDAGAFLAFLEKEERVCKYIHIYCPPHIQDLLSALSSERYGYKQRNRVQLKYNRASVTLPAVKETVTHALIDSSNINDLKAMGFDALPIFWGDDSNFLSGGYGVLLYDAEGKPACVCYSACVADGAAEVDIYTVLHHQNKGFARYAAALFVAETIKRGIVTNWDCFEDNTASLKTALGIGFQQVKQYEYLSVYFNEK